MEVVASLSQGRTAAAQCGLFTHKSFPVLFETPSISKISLIICKKMLGEGNTLFVYSLFQLARGSQHLLKRVLQRMPTCPYSLKV